MTHYPREKILDYIDTGPGPEACVVALHGRGVTGEDLVPMAEELGLPGVRWIFPHGLLAFDPMPGGREWFSMEGLSLAHWKTVTDDPKLKDFFSGLERARSAVTGLLVSLMAQGIKPNKMALIGFSQGAALALDVALFSQPLAGYAALSGILARVPSQGLAGESPEFFVGHGSHDEIIPVELGRQAAARLKSMGARTRFSEYPMGHGMCPEEMRDLREFLTRTLSLECHEQPGPVRTRRSI